MLRTERYIDHRKQTLLMHDTTSIRRHAGHSRQCIGASISPGASEDQKKGPPLLNHCNSFVLFSWFSYIRKDGRTSPSFQTWTTTSTPVERRTQSCQTFRSLSSPSSDSSSLSSACTVSRKLLVDLGQPIF